MYAHVHLLKKETLMKFRLGIYAVICAIVLAVSCQPEVVPTTNKPPQSFLDLVAAYEADAQYYGVASSSSFAKVFIVGGDIIVPKSEMTIEDCTGGIEPKAVTYDGSTGKWKVGGELTDIMRTSGEAIESFPVYAYFNEKALCIYASNNDVFVFNNINYKEQDPDNPVTPPTPITKYEIPRIYITTDNHQAINSKSSYVPGKIRVEDPSCTFSDEAVFEASMDIRGRGNTTWGMPKKPYKIKLNEKAKILGIHKDKEWVLLANYDDKTLLRNIVAMEISRRLGFSWTPTMISVELWVNDSYQGVYTFTEHKKVSKHRVNIEPATPENNSGEGLTGGYYMEFENESMNEPTWFKTTRYGVTLMLHEPEEPTAEQLDWLVNYVEAFENTLYALGHDDRGETNYYDYIDVDSFINYYILEELAKDPDANFRKSTFLTKEKGKKLELYHVWDFDITFGNCNYWGDGFHPEDFLLKGCVWYNRLFGKDRAWIEAVQKRWKEVYPQLETIPQFIDEQVKLLDGAQVDNFIKWPILGKYVWPNAVWYDTYEEEITYLKDFYIDRLYWLDEQIGQL